jgi:hypothetical protein
VEGNTITGNPSTAALAFEIYGGINCPDWVVTNNTISAPKTIFFHNNPPITIDKNIYTVFSVYIYGVGNKTFSQWQAMGHDLNSTLGSAPASPTATRTNIPPTVTFTPSIPPTLTPDLHTFTATPTNTATPTPSRTPTATLTYTQVPTATSTPTYTPVPTVTPICVLVYPDHAELCK